MTVDADTFVRCLGCWASGVTIVTSRAGKTRRGLTVSAFCSVSLEPPQVLICVNGRSNTASVIHEASAFSVNILAAGQDELSELFADKTREAVRFDGLDCPEGVTRCPHIPGALAHLDCSVTQTVEAETHVVFFGLVEAAEIHDGEPLAYFRREYRQLGRIPTGG